MPKERERNDYELTIENGKWKIVKIKQEPIPRGKVPVKIIFSFLKEQCICYGEVHQQGQGVDDGGDEGACHNCGV